MQIRGGKLEYNNTNDTNKKITRIILIFIVLIFIAMVAIICTIMYIQKTTFKVYVDGILVNMKVMIHIMENIKSIQKIQINVGLNQKMKQHHFS